MIYLNGKTQVIRKTFAFCQKDKQRSPFEFPTELLQRNEGRPFSKGYSYSVCSDIRFGTRLPSKPTFQSVTKWFHLIRIYCGEWKMQGNYYFWNIFSSYRIFKNLQKLFYNQEYQSGSKGERIKKPLLGSLGLLHMFFGPENLFFSKFYQIFVITIQL